MHLPLSDPHDYIQGEFLGSGAEGEVRKATCRQTGREVAIKRLHGRRGRSFYQELSLLSRLWHPNIVRLIDFYEQGTNRYLVYELCTGGSLQDYLYGRADFSLPMLLSLGKQLASGLEQIHQFNASHGDLKPANVLRASTEGNPLWKISDFGVCVDGSRNAEHHGYTPRYAAPERLEGKLVPASDIYALGVVLLDCQYVTRKSLPEGSQGIDKALTELIRASMNHDPYERPNAAEFLQEIRLLEKQALIERYGNTQQNSDAIHFFGATS